LKTCVNLRVERLAMEADGCERLDYGTLSSPPMDCNVIEPHPSKPASKTTPSLVQAIGLAKRVQSPEGELVILTDINLELEPGETLAIIGASGSGKSTLLGLLAGLDQPSDGTVILAGQDLRALDEDQRAAMRASLVGFVFQSFQLLPSLTAVENVMLPLELAGHSAPGSTAQRALDRVGLGARLHHYPKHLSGGEQQRVAIARAYAGQPTIMFADEPTGNLDRNNARQVRDLMFSLNRERGTTLLLVTHDPRIADPCDRLLELDGGRLVRSSQ
jgi:putative ABC transport system ATP-binding protein